METRDRDDHRFADSARTSVAPDDSSVDDELAGDSETQAVRDGIITPKQACNRCRRRKIQCNRANPCSSCVRSRSDCLYPSVKHHKEKRQRIHVSTQYEQKLDCIFEVLNELKLKVDSLSRESNTSGGSAQETCVEAHMPFSGDHNEATLMLNWRESPHF